jgi:hypothetical protein
MSLQCRSKSSPRAVRYNYTVKQTQYTRDQLQRGLRRRRFDDFARRLSNIIFITACSVVQCSLTDDFACLWKWLGTDTRLKHNHFCIQIEIFHPFTASRSSANLPSFVDFRPIGVASPIRETYCDPIACLPCFLFLFLLVAHWSHRLMDFGA